MFKLADISMVWHPKLPWKINLTYLYHVVFPSYRSWRQLTIPIPNMKEAAGNMTIRKNVMREMTIAAIISPSLYDFHAGSQVSGTK